MFRYIDSIEVLIDMNLVGYRFEITFLIPKHYVNDLRHFHLSFFSMHEFINQ